MSIAQLRSFVEVYRQGSFTKAARALGLSQPALSGQIASLEAQIERKLFTRHAQGVTPTVIADALAARVSEALDNAENALAEIKARSAVFSGRINLCGAGDLLFDLTPSRLQALVTCGLTIQLIPAGDQAIVEMLVDGRADFAFALQRFDDDPRIKCEFYGDEELVLTAAPQLADRIANAGRLGQALSANPFLTYDARSAMLQNWLTHNRIEASLGEPAMTAPDLRALRSFAITGLGWSVLPRYLIEAALTAGELAEISGPNGNPVAPYYLLWHRSAMRNPRTARVRNLLMQRPDAAET